MSTPRKKKPKPVTDPSAKKNAAILEHLEQVVADVEQVLEQPDTEARRNYLKGVLFYWLGILFEDGAADIKEFEDSTKRIG